MRDDRKRKAQARLEELLLEGLDSGEGEKITPEFFKELKKEFVKRVGKGINK